MKRTLIGVVAAAALLVTAAIAVADGFEGAKSITAVSGTFGATTASHVSQRTCTTSTGKTVVVTDGTYTGTASGPAELTGNATLHARSIINTTDNVGVVSGTLKIDASGRDTAAQLTAVYSGGQLAGLAVGHAGGSRLVANVSGGFSAAGGFASGSKIGGGTAGGSAVELAPAGCKTPPRPVPQKSEARGTISGVNSTSITVAGLTCVVPTSLQAKVAGLAVNGRAEIHCQLVNGVNTLTSVEKKS